MKEALEFRSVSDIGKDLIKAMLEKLGKREKDQAFVVWAMTPEDLGYSLEDFIESLKEENEALARLVRRNKKSILVKAFLKKLNVIALLVREGTEGLELYYSGTRASIVPIIRA